MDSIVQYIDFLKTKGFICNFVVDSGEKLICKETNESFAPNEIIIENAFRFEGDSNPEDMSIVYSITTKSGIRGTLIDAYGAYSNPDIDKFMKYVPFREENELQDTRN